MDQFSLFSQTETAIDQAVVRFRVVPEPDAGDGEPRYVAWFEPAHVIVGYVSGFFQRRLANMR